MKINFLFPKGLGLRALYCTLSLVLFGVQYARAQCTVQGPTDTVISCDPYTWPQTGITYYASVSKYDTIQSSVGCDSLVGLYFKRAEMDEVTKLLASDGGAYDRFGSNVTISGDYAFVGAREADDNGSQSGAAYVFQRNSSGQWIEVQKLTASDGAQGDFFSSPIAVDGDYVLIGAQNDDDNGSSSGSVYAFERDSTGQWIEVQKITASDGATGDLFGHSIAIYGNYAFVGAYQDNDNGSFSGSAYVFERNATGQWIEVQKITTSDGISGDRFGYSVSIYGDYAMVSAPFDNDNGINSGSIYIFKRNASGQWMENQKITASDGGYNNIFGYSVSINGDYAMVGASDDDDNGSRSGSAYILERNITGQWIENHKITASDGATDDLFGFAVAIYGGYALIGSKNDNDNGTNSGSTYLFERNATGQWLERQKITASDGANQDYFGSVAISGDYALIGAYGDDDNGSSSGSAYFFALPTTSLAHSTTVYACSSYTWPFNGQTYTQTGIFPSIGCDNTVTHTLDLTILPSFYDTTVVSACDSYTWSVDGQTYSQTGIYTSELSTTNGCDSVVTIILTINSSYSDTTVVSSCGAFTWTLNGQTYSQSGIYSDTLSRVNGCDSIVAIDLTVVPTLSVSDTVISCSAYTWPQTGETYTMSGVYYDSVQTGQNCNSVYALHFERIGMSEVKELLASDGAAGDRYGNSVAIDGNYAMVGAYGDDDHGSASGSVYVFERDAMGQWTEAQKITSSDASASDLFGRSVAIDGDYAMVGASDDDDNGSSSGSVYIFERNASGQWIEIQKITASDGAAGDFFGVSVYMDENYAIVGAFFDQDNGTESGSAYIFERDTMGQWTEVQKITGSDNAAGDRFGASVALDGDYAIVGAHLASPNGSSSGSAYLFERNASGQWSEVNKILSSDNAGGDRFGCSVALVGTTVLVGSFADDDNGATSGSAYLFERNASGQWYEVDKIIASDGVAGDYFGTSVALSNNYMMVGASRVDDNDSDAGAAYLFERNATGQWYEVDKIIASEGAANDQFGNPVALDGNYAIIGSLYDDDNGSDAGSAYIYVLPNTTDTAFVDACDSYTWAVNGQTYTQTGVYTQLFTSAQGCDSSLSLDLTIHTPYINTIAIAACDSFTWSVSGQTYFVSGLYVDSLSDINGCDSVSYLNLSIIPTFIDTAIVIECSNSSYTWPINAQTYSQSGIYSESFSSTGGCDSVYYLYLTISSHYTMSILDSTSSCEAYEWTQSGKTYYVSGTYYDTLQGSSGCDSIVGLFYDRYPSTELTKFMASDGADSDEFGSAVAVSGNYAIVGARLDDDKGIGSGSAYIFERDLTGQWMEVQKVTASDGTAYGYFGSSVALSGNLAIVGAHGDDNYRGTAYIFERSTNGQWSQIAKITASDRQDYDWFGGSVAISGSYAIVSASREDENGLNSGSAYIYEQNSSGQWIQVEKIMASDGASNDYFGWSISLSGDYAVVGSVADDGKGSAYVFERNSVGQWLQVDKLTASDRADFDRFGASVAISGDLLLIGAEEEDENGPSSGSAYIFERDSVGQWNEVEKILASDGASADLFGCSVALSDNFAVVGAFWEDGNGSNSGSAYVYERTYEGRWIQIEKLLASDGSSNDEFGYSVSISAEYILIGSPLESSSWPDAGAAYAFSLPSEADTIQVEACQSYTWAQDGQTYFQSGIYTSATVGQQACNGNDVLDLTIHPGYSDTINVNVCESYSWPLNGQEYVQSGIYADTSITLWGCDSIVVLALTIYDTYADTSSVSSCNSYLWTVDSQMYYHSGVYSQILSTVNGCDSVHVIDLTIQPEYIDSISVTTCESYYWALNQQVYGQSGIYSDTLITAHGCDSTLILDLTIHPSTIDTTAITACDSYTWTVNTQTYVQSGLYVDSLTSIFGCDSILAIELTIHPSYSAPVDSVMACDQYIWDVNDQTISQTGSYSFTTSNQNGCDSTLNLYVEIFNSPVVVDTTLVRKMTASDRSLARFGGSISVSGSYSFVGAAYQNSDQGAVYVLTDASGSWQQSQKLTASDASSNDRFGWEVDVEGDRAIIGAYEDNSNQGAAYIFELDSNGVWQEVAKLTASDGGSGDYFGYDVAIYGDYALVGARWETLDSASANSLYRAGAAYVYQRDAQGNWTEMQKLSSPDRAMEDEFSFNLEMDADELFISARMNGLDANGANLISGAGAAYVFTLSNNRWIFDQKLVANDRQADDDFGYRLSVSNDELFVAARLHDLDADGLNAVSNTGAAYVFEKDVNGNYQQSQKIVGSSRTSDNWFGFSINAHGNYLAIGSTYDAAPPHGGSAATNAGGVYVYEKNAQNLWEESQILFADDRASQDYFSSGLGSYNGEIHVGAFREDHDTNGANTVSDAGSAYFFRILQSNGGNRSPNWNVVSDSIVTVSDSEATFYGTAGFADINPCYDSIISRGVIFGQHSPLSFSDSIIEVNFGEDEFYTQLNGLSANTNYYLSSFAYNAVDTSMGSELSLYLYVAPPIDSSVFYVAPSVTTDSIARIGLNSAMIYGTITSDGGTSILDRGFYMGFSPFLDSQDSVISVNSTTNSFSALVTDLEPNLTYYFVAYATNSKGTSVNIGYPFSIDVDAPVVSTDSVVVSTYNSVTFSASVSDSGGYPILERGIVLSRSANMDLVNGKWADGLSGTGSFQILVDTLNPNTYYYGRAYAYNAVDTGWGALDSVIIVATAPIVYSDSVVEIASDSVLLYGRVTYDGNNPLLDHGFCYQDAPDPDLLDIRLIGSGSTSSFTSYLGGLQPSTTYHFRAFAYNGVDTAFGQELSITTAADCNAAFAATAAPLGTYEVHFSWNNMGSTAYRLCLRELGEAQWTQLVSYSTSKTVRNRIPGDYEFYIVDLDNGDSSCVDQFSVNCATDITYTFNAFQAPELGRLGRVRVFGTQGGKRLYDIHLVNEEGDSNSALNVRQRNYTDLPAGDYSLYVRDDFGCEAASVGQFTINAMDTNFIPSLINAPNNPPNGFRPTWHSVAGVINYQLRVVNVTDGTLQLFQTGINDTMYAVTNLPTGKLYRFNVRSRYNNGVANVVSGYSNAVSRNLTVNGNKGEQSGEEGTVTGATINLSIYPNPTNGLLYVQAPEGSRLMLIDMNGKAIAQRTVKGTEEIIDLTPLAQGVYLLEVNSGGQLYRERVVKQ